MNLYSRICNQLAAMGRAVHMMNIDTGNKDFLDQEAYFCSVEADKLEAKLLSDEGGRRG